MPAQPAPPSRVLYRKYHDSVHAFAPIFDPADPDNTIYVTTRTHGIWISHDGGTSWSEWVQIPFMATHRLHFGPSSPDRWVWYVTTFGGGVWKVTQGRLKKRWFPPLWELRPWKWRPWTQLAVGLVALGGAVIFGVLRRRGRAGQGDEPSGKEQE